MIKGLLGGPSPTTWATSTFEGALPSPSTRPRTRRGTGSRSLYQDARPVREPRHLQNMFLGREEVHQRMLNQAEDGEGAASTCRGCRCGPTQVGAAEVSSLSGGQRQTVAIARAVLQKAELVILDEPTTRSASPDPAVLALVRRLADAGVGVIIISHNLADVLPGVMDINGPYPARWSPSWTRKPATTT